MKAKIALTVSVFVCLISNGAFAKVYKCVEKGGKVSYSNTSCPANAVSSVIPDFFGPGNQDEISSSSSSSPARDSQVKAPGSAEPSSALPIPSGSLPTGVVVSPEMMETLKKQLGTLFRQRELPSLEKTDKEKVLEGY